MIDSSILFLTVTGSGMSTLQKHGLAYAPQSDFGSVFVYPLLSVFKRVIVYDLWKRCAEIGTGKANLEVIALALKERPNYLLWPSMEYEIKESTLEQLRGAGIRTVGWFFDDETRFDDYSRWWIPYLDFCLTCDKESVTRYEQLGGRAIHCLCRANADVFKKLNLPLVYDVSFVGRRFGDRHAWMEQLAEKGINIQAFGSGWSNGYITTAEMVGVFNQSRINLNFVQAYSGNARPQMKARFFEVCLAGGFLLSEYIPGIEEYFEIDREIVCFKNLAEAAEKIEYYLSHETERNAIANAGWMRAHRDHTQHGLYERTFDRMEKIITAEAVGNSIPTSMDLQDGSRQGPSHYHYRWAKALMIEGYPQPRWREEIELSIAYNPQNRKAGLLRLIGLLPRFLHQRLIDISDNIFALAGKLRRTASSLLRKIVSKEARFPA